MRRSCGRCHLPSPHDRLVMLWERYPNGFLSQVIAARFRRLGRPEPVIRCDGLRSSRTAWRFDWPDGAAEQVASQMVSARFFDILGVTPIAGRTFVASDAVEPNSVVLSEGFWRRRFGADPTLVGRSITIAGRPQIVIGIVPDRFRVVPATISNAGSEPAESLDGLQLPAGRQSLAAGSSLHVCGRSHQGRCDLRRGAARHDGDRQTQRGALPSDEHRSYPGSAAVARGARRLRDAIDLDLAARRCWFRAADVLRQRGEPAPGADDVPYRASWRCAPRLAPVGVESFPKS